MTGRESRPFDLDYPRKRTSVANEYMQCQLGVVYGSVTAAKSISEGKRLTNDENEREYQRRIDVMRPDPDTSGCTLHSKQPRLFSTPQTKPQRTYN